VVWIRRKVFLTSISASHSVFSRHLSQHTTASWAVYPIREILYFDAAPATNLLPVISYAPLDSGSCHKLGFNSCHDDVAS
jgi:hypothetical protein